jgi:hypothetical protein
MAKCYYFRKGLKYDPKASRTATLSGPPTREETLKLRGPALDDNDPHGGVAVLGPGADTEDLGLGQLPERRP